DMPKDTFWALGLGDSFVVVCPSLDLVAVRLGVGSTKSQLPGGDDWGKRVEGFFRLVVRAAREGREWGGGVGRGAGAPAGWVAAGAGRTRVAGRGGASRHRAAPV